MAAPIFEKLTPPKLGTRVNVDTNGRWNIPDDPIICLIRGDGIGRDVDGTPGITTCAVRILDAAVEKAYKGKRRTPLVRYFCRGHRPPSVLSPGHR